MKNRIIRLDIPASPEFFPVARAMTEKSSTALGLGQKESMRVGMATEEIFMYLCRTSPGQELSIRSSWGGSCVNIEFGFSARHFPLHSFNLTSRVDISDEQGLDEVGLLIASRMVDRFSVETGGDDKITLILTKEKNYEKAKADSRERPKPSDSFTVRTPEPEEAFFLADSVAAIYPPEEVPRAFAHPGMFADMLRHGQSSALIAVSPGGEILGGIEWEWTAGAKTAQCLGPYILTEEADSAICEGLLNGCLESLAKLPVLGLLNRRPNHDLPVHYFELIGELPITGLDGTLRSIPHYFRQMHEDPGSSVWADERLEPFLKEEYGLLALPRKILKSGMAESHAAEPSVLFAKIDRSRKTATLWPVATGRDIRENVLAHIAALAPESTGGLYFSLDLGRPWQAEWISHVMGAGFAPRLVMPYAGHGDVVLFSL